MGGCGGGGGRWQRQNQGSVTGPVTEVVTVPLLQVGPVHGEKVPPWGGKEGGGGPRAY